METKFDAVKFEKALERFIKCAGNNPTPMYIYCPFSRKFIPKTMNFGNIDAIENYKNSLREHWKGRETEFMKHPDCQ
jgi:hypothetical protein